MAWGAPSVLQTLIRWTGAIIILNADWGVLLVKGVLETIRSIEIEWRINVVVPWIGMIVMARLWRVERKIRRTAVQREHRRVTELEEKIDAGRTSSGFKETGEIRTEEGEE